MAKYNEILTGRHNRFISRLFGMKGTAPASQLSGDVQMVHPFFHGTENRILESWTIWGATKDVPASVGNVDTFQLRMPTGTNVLAVIDKLTVTSTASDIETVIGVKAQSVDLANLLTITTRDTRQLATTGSVAVVSWTNVTVVGPNAFFTSKSGPTGDLMNDLCLNSANEIVISPGFCLQVQSLTANVAMIVSCWWRERSMEETERTP